MPVSWKIPLDGEMQRQLYEASLSRVSCRRFIAAPSTAQWHQLLALSEQAQGKTSRLPLSMCAPSLFQTLLGRMQGFSNATRIVGVVAKGGDPLSIVHAGFDAELLGLCIQHMELGYCWVTGTFKRRETGLKLEKDEKLVGVMPFGVPQKDENTSLQRSRKPAESLCTDDRGAYPLVFRELTLAVRMAPSAINAQPWRFTLESDTTLRIAVKLPTQRVDLGIALCHAELALGATDHTTTVEPDGLTARISL